MNSSDVFTLPVQRLEYLVKLPALLNSSLAVQRVIQLALGQLKTLLNAEAATVFLIDEDSKTLKFWALRGEEDLGLGGKSIPQGKGIVGWVISNNQGVVVKDVASDPRFFKEVDKETDFITRDLICVPLVVRGEKTIGAVQVLNSTQGGFKEKDLYFLDQCAQQIALAVDNAQLYESLLEKNTMLEKLEKRRSDMLAVVAHEIRTPLNVIQNGSELIASGLLDTDEEKEQMLEGLKKGVSRLTRVSGQLQNLASLSESALEIRKSPVKISTLFETAQKFFERASAKRKLSLKFDIDRQLSLVMADRSYIQIVLHNLISNAIRFTADGGQVTVKATPQMGDAQIVVADTGIGISAEDLPVVFEKFYGVIPAIEHHSGELEFKSGGLGIGLATAKAILKAHGSSIDAESELGKGSKFTFSLAKV